MNNDKNLITFISLFLVIGLVVGFIARGFISGTYDDVWQAARERVEGDSGEEPRTVLELKGEIKELHSDSLVLSVGRVNPLEDQDLQERIAKINDSTIIILWRPKTAVEMYGQEIADKIAALEAAAEAPGLDRVQEEVVMGQIQELQFQYNLILEERAKPLRQQLADLKPEATADKMLIERQLNNLLSNYYSEDIDFKMLTPGDKIKVTAAEDIAQEKKFTATKIEVTRN